MIDKNNYIKLAEELGFKVTKDLYNLCDAYISVYADEVLISMYNTPTGKATVYDCNKFKLDDNGELTDEGDDFSGTKLYDFEDVKVEFIKIAKKIKSLRIEEKMKEIFK